MRALNIIESVYSGIPYKDSEKVLVDPTEVNLYFKFDTSRFTVKSKLSKIKVNPYLVNFDKYCELIARTKITTGIALGNLSLYSSQEEFEPFIAEYGSSNAVITEPTGMTDLMYSQDELSPLGIMALMFRKHYDDERFKRYINSTLLKSYRKVKLNNGPSIYIRPDYEHLLTSAVQFHDSGVSWSSISAFLIECPYIFIWRD